MERLQAVKTIQYLLIATGCLVVAAGCGRPPAKLPTLVWDFSTENAVDHIPVQPRQWVHEAHGGKSANIEVRQRIKMLLPYGRTLDRYVTEFTVSENRRGVTSEVIILFEPQTISNACDLATRLAKTWNLSTKKIDEAMQNNGGPFGVDDAVEVFNPKQLNPNIEVRLGPSFDQWRPHCVQLILTWVDPATAKWMKAAVTGKHSHP